MATINFWKTGDRYVNVGIMEAEMVSRLSIQGPIFIHWPFASRRVFLINYLFLFGYAQQLDATVIGSDAE